MVRRLSTYLHRTSTTLFMLLAFITYVSSITLFTHQHIIDGRAVSHSHFHSGTNEQPSHTHTSQQFKSLSALAQYVALAAVAPLQITSPTQWAISLYEEYNTSLFTRSLRLFSLRAPPSLI